MTDWNQNKYIDTIAFLQDSTFTDEQLNTLLKVLQQAVIRSRKERLNNANQRGVDSISNEMA
jgi:hypothetical protein